MRKQMQKTDELKLGSVQKTLFLPLWGRAVETQKKKPLLVDNTAVSIVNSISYDFTAIAKNISNVVRAGWIARSIFFDDKIKTFIAAHPEATIVNIGCGLDTTFDRVDNGRLHWIDLDLPDTIDLRRKYIPESERRRFISKSVFDQSWYGEMRRKDCVMLLIAGVLYYFSEADVKKLFIDFHFQIPGVEIVFDYVSRFGMKVSNKQVIKGGGMDASAYLKWSIDNILEIEGWDGNIEVISHMPLYKDHKKKFSVPRRLGMNIADMLKPVSLAHIAIK